MGLLDGGIQSVFGAAFGPLYLPGILTRVTLNENGKGGGTETPVEQSCRVQVDACTEQMRAQAGYTEKDVRLLVLQANIIGGDIDTDCKVKPSTGRHAGQTFRIQWVDQDPASSYWDCRGTPE